MRGRLILRILKSGVQGGEFQARTSFPTLDTCNIKKAFFQAFGEVRAAIVFTTAMKRGDNSFVEG